MQPAPGFIEVRAESWKDAKTLGEHLIRTCVFRGMRRNDWPLKTSLERAAEQFGCPSKDIWYREKEILKIFKSRAHQYIQSPPKETENIEWLSLIQHHGGPTRLLDFTESFYIASFFAIESAEGDACVWAVNRAVLAGKIMDMHLSKFEDDRKNTSYPSDIIALAEEFVSNQAKGKSLTLAIIPPRLNERLAVQRGLFLFPCDLEKSFVNNLCSSFGLPFDTLNLVNAQNMSVDEVSKIDAQMVSIWKINLPAKLHTSIILDLYSMNIDAASLFPGLAGFAQSLSYVVRQTRQDLKKFSSISVYPIGPDIKLPKD